MMIPTPFRRTIPQMRKHIEDRMMRENGWINEVALREELKQYSAAKRAILKGVESGEIKVQGCKGCGMSEVQIKRIEQLRQGQTNDRNNERAR